MAEYANSLVAVWDGASKGTGHMIDIAKKHGLKTLAWTRAADSNVSESIIWQKRNLSNKTIL